MSFHNFLFPTFIILGIFSSFYCLTNSTFDENGKLNVEVDKTGEWSAPIEMPPSREFRLEWIDEECCWKSKLTIDLVGTSPPYLAVPFGRMKVGEKINIDELWRSTLADYRGKLEELAEQKGENDSIAKRNAQMNSIAKRNAQMNSIAKRNAQMNSIAKRNAQMNSIAKRNAQMNWIRLNANCPLRIAFQ